MLSEHRNGGPTGTSFAITYTYDPVSNRLTQNDGAVLTYTYSNADRLTVADAGGTPCAAEDASIALIVFHGSSAVVQALLYFASLGMVLGIQTNRPWLMTFINQWSGRSEMRNVTTPMSRSD